MNFVQAFTIFADLKKVFSSTMFSKENLESLFFFFSLSRRVKLHIFPALCLYLNVRQFKCIGFVCNIFNYLNKENKLFTSSLSLFFVLSSLAFSLYLNVRKLKGSQILTFTLFIFLFFFFFSSFLFISHCYFVNFALNSGKRRERGRERERERVFNRSFSIKNYTTVLFFLSFFCFFARTFIFIYISIVILYVFLSLFLVLIFFHFFGPLYFFLFLFLFFGFLFISINSRKRKERERETELILVISQ
jgi:hypothetical protein